MSIFETNIESLEAKLEGTVKLLELTITQMQEECEDIEGVERRNQAMFFLEKTNEVYMTCLNRILMDLGEITAGLLEETEKIIHRGRTA